jgi:glycosyltransferase involved in cell wall biosynthesis
MSLQPDWISPEGTPGMVSVIVTAYNQKDYLREALASVFAQTYRPLECVVVNDGSTDGTEGVIDEFAIQAPKSDVNFVPISQKNSGAQRARNAGVPASQGEFIQYLDGDDILAPEKIEEQVKHIASHPGCDVVYGDSKFWIKSGDGPFITGDRIGIGKSADCLLDLIEGRWNSPFAYLSRRTAVSETGWWDPELRIAQDYGYFLKMAALGYRFEFAAAHTGLYRKHSTGTISEGSMKLRARATLQLLRSAEEVGHARKTFDPKHWSALTRAYLRVSYWSYGVDRDCWQESITHALRINPKMAPERKFDRILHRVLGPWRAEECLGRVRAMKRSLTGFQRARPGYAMAQAQ